MNVRTTAVMAFVTVSWIVVPDRGTPPTAGASVEDVTASAVVTRIDGPATAASPGSSSSVEAHRR